MYLGREAGEAWPAEGRMFVQVLMQESMEYVQGAKPGTQKEQEGEGSRTDQLQTQL